MPGATTHDISQIAFTVSTCSFSWFDASVPSRFPRMLLPLWRRVVVAFAIAFAFKIGLASNNEAPYVPRPD